MHKYHLKMTKLTALIVVMLGMAAWGGQLASAATLTATLRQLLNHDIQNFAEKLKLDTFSVMPIRFVSVKGDAAQFRAMNWMDDGATGGIKEMSYDGDIGKGDHLTFEGHAIPGDNDLGAHLKLTKGNGGYINMDYGNFRKWYDVYGGYFPNFTGSSEIQRLSADPKMDMGHFLLEAGSSSGDAPGLSLSYEHDSKEGIKNMLTWGTVTSGVSRKIYPSWQQESLATDAITLTGRADVAGFKVNGKQRAEFTTGRIFREDLASTTPTYQSHTQEPQAKQLVSSVKADRWTLNDKTYMMLGYQYQHLKNDMLDVMRVYNTAGVTQSNSNNRYIDAFASRDSHTWIQNLSSNLTKDLNFVTKFKEEIVSQDGHGFGQGYSGGSDRTVNSENQISRTGESVSLRYAGIPKTSLYTDWDFQQTRNWLYKERVASSTYENVDSNPEMTGVVGMRYVMNKYFNMTSQVKHRASNSTYDTLYNNDVGITISRLRTTTNEWSNRLTWKPTRWFENSVRVQLLDNIYRVQGLDQAGFTNTTDWLKSQGNSRVYTYDIVLQPTDQWMFDVGASLNNFKVSTPAAQTAVSNGGIPVFVANIYSILFTTSYAPRDDFSIFTSAQYSRANDFHSQGFVGMPYGVNNESYNIDLGCKWSPKKDLTLSPHYGYYAYTANPNDNLATLGYGSYSAHVAWLDATLTW